MFIERSLITLKTRKSNETMSYKKILHNDDNKKGVFGLFKSINICIILFISGLFSSKRGRRCNIKKYEPL